MIGLTLRGRIRRVLQRAGVDVRRYQPGGEVSDYEAQLFGVIRDLGVVHVIDVGGNAGQFGTRVRGLGFDGRIDSFEPASGPYALLRERADGDPKWFTHRLALTDTAGPLTLSVYANDHMTSVFRPSSESYRVWPQSEWDRSTCISEHIDGLRLEDADIPCLGSTLLKVDTQGHDWNVVEGAGSVLGRVDAIMTELSFIPLYESSVNAWDTMRRLDGLGFGLVSLQVISRAMKERRILEADGLFVRPPDLPSSRTAG